jgi:SAM-dependent methyltransferase
MSESERIREYFETARWRPSAGRLHLLTERSRLLHTIAGHLSTPITDLAICDVGCGSGSDLVSWRQAGVTESRLAGTELLPERAQRAKDALPEADIRVVDGFELPFASGVFDLCTASLVLSTIRSSSQRSSLLHEMIRVTSPGGAVIVYDFVIRKPWNREVAPVTSSSLRATWRAPDETYRAAPLLPALDLALRLPKAAATRLIAVLPRSHRVWVWHVGSSELGPETVDKSADARSGQS